MLDLGFQELIIIFVVVLLVFGPQKLPELSRVLGKAVRELRTAVRGVKDSIDGIEEEADSVRKDMSEGISEPPATEEEKNEEVAQKEQAETGDDR